MTILQKLEPNPIKIKIKLLDSIPHNHNISYLIYFLMFQYETPYKFANILKKQSINQLHEYLLYVSTTLKSIRKY